MFLGMHWLGWTIIGFLLLVAWMGRPYDFPQRKGKRLAPRVEELEDRS